jgi:hypothetical protein
MGQRRIEDLEEYKQLELKLEVTGNIVFIDDAKARTLELIGEQLTVPSSFIQTKDAKLESLPEKPKKLLRDLRYLATRRYKVSRRKVLTFFDKRTQCTNVFQFLTRRDISTDMLTTDLVVFMRSCDLKKKLPNDLKLFKYVLETYCVASLTVPDKIIVFFGSLHMYL